MPENKHTEYKLKVTPEIEKEVVAFLNANEGGSAEVASQITEEDTPQDTLQVDTLLKMMVGQHSRLELQDLLALADRENFRLNYLQPAINAGYVALTFPEKPTSRNQKYYLTAKGKQRLNTL